MNKDVPQYLRKTITNQYIEINYEDGAEINEMKMISY